MARKDRNYETIIRGCQAFATAVEEARAAAVLLKKEADTAEATLKDRVAKKNIDTIRELSEVILKTTATGEERVRELERRMKAEKARFEEMER